MGESVTDQLSWSIRLDRDEYGGRVFRELVELVPDLLALHFPSSCGYETRGTRLGGPLEGVRWTVTRGSFRGELDVQRYARFGADRGSPSATALRVVASAGVLDTSEVDPESLERRVVGWALVGWGLGCLTLGVVLLGMGGLAPVWAEALALVPAVAAWRASVACLVQRAGGSAPALLPPRHELAALASPRGPAPGLSPAVADGLRRWRELLPALQAQRDLLQGACGLTPFRNPGHLEATSDMPQARVRQVLAAASSSFTWPRPALVVATRRARATRSARAGRMKRSRPR